MNRLLKYLVTERGRATTLNIVAATGIASFSVTYIPHTIGIDKLREFMQLYTSGFEKAVPDKIAHRFEQALLACGATEFDRQFLKPFMAYGFDTLHIGSAKSRFGAKIGVPSNYVYENDTHVETGKILLKGEPVAWSSEWGQKLREALVLTEDEQIFGIARSVLQAKTNKLLVTSLFAPFTLFTVYAMGSAINRRGNLYARPLGVRLVLYSILSVFAYGLHSFATDYTEVYYDTQVDRQLCDIGPEFVDAGIRFYQKQLHKNAAIRHLSNDRNYTPVGNVNFGLRQKSMPLTLRKSYFEMRLRELQEGAANATAKA